jgi:hypothetical protein
MSKPTDAAPSEDYTFTRPEGLLAHYTDAAAAFEHILPEQRLRMSPYRNMRDPVESQDILPAISWSGDRPGAERATWAGPGRHQDGTRRDARAGVQWGRR